MTRESAVRGFVTFGLVNTNGSAMFSKFSLYIGFHQERCINGARIMEKKVLFRCRNSLLSAIIDFISIFFVVEKFYHMVICHEISIFGVLAYLFFVFLFWGGVVPRALSMHTIRFYSRILVGIRAQILVNIRVWVLVYSVC